jgi:hypothetical protein
MEGDFCTLHVGCSLGIKFQVIPFSSLTCQSFVCLLLEILAETVMATVRVSKSALVSDERLCVINVVLHQQLFLLCSFRIKRKTHLM